MRIERSYSNYSWIDETTNKTICSCDFQNQTYIGKSGRPLKRVPNYNLPMFDFIQDCTTHGTFSNELAMRIVSFGLIGNVHYFNYSNSEKYIQNWKFYFPIIKEIFSEHSDGSSFDLDWAITIREKRITLTKLFGEEIAEFIENNCSRDIKCFDILPIKIWKRCIKTYIEQNKIAEKLENDFPFLVVYPKTSLSTYIDKVTENKGIISKLPLNNITSFESIDEHIKAWKNQAKEKYFEQDFSSYIWENEDYRITAPRDFNHLVAIGEWFHNCASGYEWNNYLSTNTRYIFIAEPKKTGLPKICLDIDIESNQITQFLERYNRYPSNRTAQLFKDEYQSFLDNSK